MPGSARPSPAIVLVGCGNMGGALLAGWLKQDLSPSAIAVVEPDPTRGEVLAEKGVGVVADAAALPAEARPLVVVFAVKPQVIDAVAPAYRPLTRAAPAFLSVAAGTPIARLARHLGEEAAIIRAMPNTPAAIGQGASVCVGNAFVTAQQRAFCGRLLAAVGSVHWVEDEALLDAVTALSGSGPAYVFLLAEALAEAGVAAGLPPDLAQRLARETIVGAGALLAASPLPASVLRQQVTSPGGTTAAALSVLMADDGLGALLTRAVAAATSRSRRLASG